MPSIGLEEGGGEFDLTENWPDTSKLTELSNFSNGIRSLQKSISLS